MSSNSLLLSFIAFFSNALGEDYIPEYCNYAAVGGSFPFYYPIDACESDINVTESTTYSFKYVCNENNTVEKYMYSTFDCDGTPNETITNMTYLEIEHYSCDHAFSCDYAIACSFLECNTNSSDTECNLCSAESYEDLLTQNHDTHCRPYIKNECIGSNLSYAYSYQCYGGVLSEIYKEYSCDNDGFVLDQFGGDSSCKDEDFDDKYAYYIVDCNPFVTEPECNYAATGVHNYPIGACETDVNATSGEMISFKYVCNSDDKVEMEVYTSFDCYGEPNVTLNGSWLDLEDYQCRLEDCSYAVGCSFADCGDDDECNTCSGKDIMTLIQTQDTHCFPYITNECFGSYGFNHQAMCTNGEYPELSEVFYYGSCNGSLNMQVYNDTFGGDSDTCLDDDYDDIYNYYQIDCEPEIIQPECNYVAGGYGHFYPINACESYNWAINDTTSNKLSYKYVCTEDGEVEKYLYYDSINCEGDKLVLTGKEDGVEHYNCKAARDCNYVIACSYEGCAANTNDTSCSVCSGANYIENYGYKHDSHCFPVINDECFGIKHELLHMTTCSDGVFKEDFYWGGRTCNEDTYSFSDEFGGVNTTCIADWQNEYTYYEIECVYAPTSFPTEAPSVKVTDFMITSTTEFPTVDDSQANIISIFVALIYANIILFIS